VTKKNEFKPWFHQFRIEMKLVKVYFVILFSVKAPLGCCKRFRDFSSLPDLKKGV